MRGPQPIATSWAAHEPGCGRQRATHTRARAPLDPITVSRTHDHASRWIARWHPRQASGACRQDASRRGTGNRQHWQHAERVAHGLGGRGGALSTTDRDPGRQELTPGRVVGKQSGGGVARPQRAKERVAH
eukprot:6186095-Pleurochrysis_carterae.AAC.1